MLEVIEVKQVCFCLPSAWDIKSADGRILYAKYRRGTLSLFERIQTPECDWQLQPIPLRRMNIGDAWAGLMGTHEMIAHLELKPAKDAVIYEMKDPNEGVEWDEIYWGSYE